MGEGMRRGRVDTGASITGTAIPEGCNVYGCV